jgi:hypothetical protein
LAETQELDGQEATERFRIQASSGIGGADLCLELADGFPQPGILEQQPRLQLSLGEAADVHSSGANVLRRAAPQQQDRKREVIAWAPPAAIQLKAFLPTRVSAPDLIDGRIPTIDFFPANVVRHRTARWGGVRAKTMQIINHKPFEYRFKQQYHLLIAVEQGVCHEAETFIEGLPISTVRNCSHRRPRLLTRAICLYIDPYTVPVDPDFRGTRSLCR